MRRTPWFERHFPAIDDNGLLPGILERLDGTAPRLRALLPQLNREFQAAAGWSVAQEVGHLLDLEPLWRKRVNDIVTGQEMLTATDLTNRATHEGAHDQRPLPELVDEWARFRQELVLTLRAVTDAELQRSAKHPRLGTPMRLIDLAYFVAEHDDHHLARLRELSR